LNAVVQQTSHKLIKEPETKRKGGEEQSQKSLHRTVLKILGKKCERGVKGRSKKKLKREERKGGNATITARQTNRLYDRGSQKRAGDKRRGRGEEKRESASSNYEGGTTRSSSTPNAKRGGGGGTKVPIDLASSQRKSTL